jgi:hypothetical protein
LVAVADQYLKNGFRIKFVIFFFSGDDDSGSCGSQGMNGMNESKLVDLLNGSEYVPTYEDKDGDWMLVGDVPWE